MSARQLVSPEEFRSALFWGGEKTAGLILDRGLALEKRLRKKTARLQTEQRPTLTWRCAWRRKSRSQQVQHQEDNDPVFLISARMSLPRSSSTISSSRKSVAVVEWTFHFSPVNLTVRQATKE
jgi:hypothetical protein